MNLRDKLRNNASDELEAVLPAEGAADEAAPRKAEGKRRPAAKKKAAPSAEAPKAGAKTLPKLDVNRRFLMLAGLVAGMAAVMAAMYLSNSAAGLSEGGTKVEVVVAAGDIAAGMKLTEDLLTTKAVPKAYLPTGYFEKYEDLANRLAIAPMVAGEPVIEVRTSEPNPKFGIAYLLKSGERAKSITVDSASGLAGLIKPGNEVDLIATIPDPNDSQRRIGTPILQKARVIAAGDMLLGEVRSPDEEEQYNASGISSEGTITLAIPAGKIGLITLLEDLGNLKMVLRAAGDEAVAKTPFSDEMIMALVSGKVPPKAAPKPAAQPVAEPARPVAPREVWRPVARPQPVQRPVAPPAQPKPKPAQPKAPVEVIQFGGD